MNALMSSRPRRGSCSEYLSSMSCAVISSTTPRLTRLPQNSANQRPTTALLSSSLLIGMAPLVSSKPPASADDLCDDLRLHRASHTPFLDFKSKAESRELRRRWSELSPPMFSRREEHRGMSAVGISQARPGRH